MVLLTKAIVTESYKMQKKYEDLSIPPKGNTEENYVKNLKMIHKVLVI